MFVNFPFSFFDSLRQSRTFKIKQKREIIWVKYLPAARLELDEKFPMIFSSCFLLTFVVMKDRSDASKEVRDVLVALRILFFSPFRCLSSDQPVSTPFRATFHKIICPDTISCVHKQFPSRDSKWKGEEQTEGKEFLTKKNAFNYKV